MLTVAVSFVHILRCYTRYRLGKDALDSALVYTRGRDLHCVGIILLQMLLGVDVVDRYPDAHNALQNCTFLSSSTLFRAIHLTNNTSSRDLDASATLR